MHILCCASSQTSFNGGDEIVNIHEILFGHAPNLVVVVFNEIFLIDEKMRRQTVCL